MSKKIESVFVVSPSGVIVKLGREAKIKEGWHVASEAEIKAAAAKKKVKAKPSA